MLTKFLCTLSLLLMLHTAPVRPSDDVAKLTGGGQREWDYLGLGSYKSNGECDGGSTWTFSSGDGSRGRVTKKKCVNSRLVVESVHSLRMWTKPSGVFAVTLDEEDKDASRTYEVRFPETRSTRLEMSLTLTHGTKSDGFRQANFYSIN